MLEPYISIARALVCLRAHAFAIISDIYKIMWQYISLKSLMAEWLEQVSQRHEMYCHDLKVMSSNRGWVDLEVWSTSVLNRT